MSKVSIDRLGAFLHAAAETVLGDGHGRAAEETFAILASERADDPMLDGRAASTLHPNGLPLELSVTGGAEVDPVLRFTTEAGTRFPFFGPRLAAQRAALGAAVDRLPDATAAVASDLLALPELAFPDAAAVPARTRQALLLGAVHHRDERDGPIGIKVYANASAGAVAVGGQAVHAWPDLTKVTASLIAHPGLRLHFVAAEVSASGVTRKLYFRTTASITAAHLEKVLSDAGADPAGLADVIGAAGLEVVLRRRSTFVCRAVQPDGTMTTTVHLQLGPLAASGADAARYFARTWTGGDGVIDAATRAGEAASEESKLPWSLALLGARLPAPADDAGARLNVYVTPSASG